uniref:Guanine nucleotide-binding protein G(O) subunit alpha n=1 Tax=Ascaris lumbricoides TaxID=6252 RepID=A0A0M3ICH2_ASCLU
MLDEVSSIALNESPMRATHQQHKIFYSADFVPLGFMKSILCTRNLILSKNAICHVNNAIHRMVDVGGQRSERRKWIHCFDNVNMVLFVVAMSEFDQGDPEDETQVCNSSELENTVLRPSKLERLLSTMTRRIFVPTQQFLENRMIQSQQIFKTIVQSDYFKNASIVLFLNKFDIFQEKIKYTSLKKCWPEYNGSLQKRPKLLISCSKFFTLMQSAIFTDCLINEPVESTTVVTGDDSVEDCTKFLQKQFQRCVPNRQKYFAFVTTATDTNNIDLVFGSAVAHIVNQNLKATGLHE